MYIAAFIYNCQNLEATQVSFIGWTDKLWYIHTMEYYSKTKKKKSCQTMKGHRETVDEYY